MKKVRIFKAGPLVFLQDYDTLRHLETFRNPSRETVFRTLQKNGWQVESREWMNFSKELNKS